MIKEYGRKIGLGILAILTLGLVACSSSSNTAPVAGAVSSTTVSGSAGDGPVVNAAVSVVDANGNAVLTTPVNPTTDPYTAKFSFTVPSGTATPLLITVSGGTDIVSNAPQDFPLTTAVTTLPAGGAVTGNANPLSTLSVATAKALGGGKLTTADLYTATSNVLGAMGFGLPSSINPLSTDVYAGNVAQVLKANEAAAEMIRRTATKTGKGVNVIVAELANDLTSGSIDGKVKAGITGLTASPYAASIAATALVQQVQVSIETLANNLTVTDTYGAARAAASGVNFVAILDKAAKNITTTGTPTAIKNVVADAAFLAQTKVAINVAKKLSGGANTALNTLQTTVIALKPGVVPSAADIYTLTTDLYSANTAITTAQNNATTGTNTVTALADTQAPVITLKGIATVTTEVGLPYIDRGATAKDNIDGTLTPSKSGAVNTAAVGSYFIIYSAMDAAGNAAISRSRLVNVVDTTKPVIQLLGANPYTIAQGSSFVDAGSTVTDNYSTGLTAVVTGTVNAMKVGVYTLTYNVKDAAGNVAATVSRTVNVTDQTAPVIKLLGINPLTIAQGSTFIDAGSTVSDNYSTNLTAVVTGVMNAMKVGVYTLTYNVKDAAGNAAKQVSRTVKVTDQTAPMITLTGANPQVIALGATYIELYANVTDNVDIGLGATINSAAVNTASIGSYTVTYDVTDAAGNAAKQVSRTVNVTDQTAPVITLLGANPYTIAQGSSFVDAGSTVTDNYSTGLTATVTGTVNAMKVGVYTLTYNVKDAAGNAAKQVSRTVKVTDQTAPVITLLGANPYTIAQGSSFVDAGSTVTDNYSTNLTAVVTGTVNAMKVGVYTLTYNVKDAAGNAAKQVSRTVKVTDQTAPVIALLGANPYTIAQGSTFIDAGSTVSDNYSTNLTAVITGTVNAMKVGVYTLTYNVKDAAGNAAKQVSRTVKVTDQTAPVIALLGANPYTIAQGSSFVDAGSTVSDNYSTNLTAVVTGTVNAMKVGVYTLTYNVKDAAGNAAKQVSRTVKVTDQTAPVIALLGANPYTIAQGSTFIDAGSTVSDNYSTNLTAVVTGTVNTMKVGVYTLTYNVKDAAGNAAKQVSRTVKVTDQTPPMIKLTGANPLTVVQNATFADPGSVVTDNVDIGLSATVTGAVDTAVIGAYTLSYNAVDAAANAATTVTRTVNVVINKPTLGSFMTGGKSISFLDAYPDFNNRMSYNYNASSIGRAGQFISNNFTWNPVSGAFDPSPTNNSSFLLNASGWLLVDGNQDTLVDNGVAGIVATHNNGSTSTHLLASSSNLAGSTIVQSLSTNFPNLNNLTSWTSAIDPYAAFSANAQKVSISSTENNDVYSISIWTGCQTPLGATNNCNVASYWDHTIKVGNSNVNATQLNQLFSIIGSKLPKGDGTLQLYKDVRLIDAGNNQNYSVNLMANAVSDMYGEARIYLNNNGGTYGAYDWSNPNPTTRNPALRTPAFIATWNRTVAFGQTLLELSVPATMVLPQWTIGVSNVGFAVQDSYARPFTFSPKGSVSTSAHLNNAGITDVTTNFIGPVGSFRRAVSGNTFISLDVKMDPYTGAAQNSGMKLSLGVYTPDLLNNTVTSAQIFRYVNAVAGALNTKVRAINFTPYNQLQQQTGSGAKKTFEFSKDGEFAVANDIAFNGSLSARLTFLVKKTTVMPTLASVAGVYRLVLLAHDSTSAPATALAGYTENGTLTLDGYGSMAYAATNTSISTGTAVFTPVNRVNVYTVDAYGAVLNAPSNGHLILSANGQYGLYEIHTGATQAWGIAIKQHTASIPFNVMNKGVSYDIHIQNTAFGQDLHKALDVRQLTPTFGIGSDVQLKSMKAFAPVQLAPALICGTPTTAACVGRDILLTYAPVTPNVTRAAVNGEFTVGLTSPPFTSYISQDGGVFWTDDGEAGSIIIGVTKGVPAITPPAAVLPKNVVQVATLKGQAVGIVRVPISIKGNSNAIGSVVMQIQYDTAKITPVKPADVSLGADALAAGWSLLASPTPPAAGGSTIATLQLTLFGLPALSTANIALANINFNVLNLATAIPLTVGVLKVGNGANVDISAQYTSVAGSIQ